MLQISGSESRPSQPAIIVGGTPFLMTVKISTVRSRTVVPLAIGQVRRLLSTLLGNDREGDARLR